MIKYSVIVISLNEEEHIVECINSIKQGRGDVEIILSDGGSFDRTIEKASRRGVTIISSKAGRGIQFNRGAAVASGEILLFLHADTQLPKGAFRILDKYFCSDETQVGTFRLGFDTRSMLLKLYSMFTVIDSAFTRFGDQCVVVRKKFYDQLGGFKDYPLFEDVDFLRGARKNTKVYSFPSKVITSSRRFIKNGMIRQQILNGWYLTQFLLGTSPFKLAEKYNSKRNLLGTNIYHPFPETLVGRDGNKASSLETFRLKTFK